MAIGPSDTPDHMGTGRVVEYPLSEHEIGGVARTYYGQMSFPLFQCIFHPSYGGVINLLFCVYIQLFTRYDINQLTDGQQ